MSKPKKLNKKMQGMQVWIEARKHHHLSHAQVQMARELGMNPSKLGKIDNDDQEPWKEPLPLFIEHLYEKRFGRTRPEEVVTMKGRIRRERAKKEARATAKTQHRGEAE